MGHEIDLSKYKLRTDLAVELINENIEGITYKIEKENDVTVTDVLVNKMGSSKIGKKEGHYITIEFSDITDHENGKIVECIFSKQLIKLIKLLSIKKDDSCLIVGLGNEKSTPDSLGPLVINDVLVTNHLFSLGSVEEGFRRVASIVPGVTGTTGLETSNIISSIVNTFKPDFVIVIDALASQSVERVNKTIQMTDAGINPGSGIGNSRKEISYSTLNIPVIAIGVPTVVDAVTIVSDTINYMHKHYSYSRTNVKNPINKLLVSQINYLKKEISINKKDKETLLGIVGSLSDMEVKQLLFEVLTPIGYNLMVTPKEVDFLVSKTAILIANGINSALHDKVLFE